METRKGTPRGTVNDLTGHVYGRLTVLFFAGFKYLKNTKSLKPKRFSAWWCECSCDKQNIVRVISLALRRGNTRSCGCIKRELDKAGRKKSPHGMKESAEYRAWSGAKSRCYNPTNRKYKNYGARGIVMCDRWRKSFVNFYADMGPRPSADHSLERDNVNGNYEPNNCKWGTLTEQGRNKTNTVYLVYKNEKRCASEWAEIFNLPSGIIKSRIGYGWPTDDVLEKPVKINSRNKNRICKHEYPKEYLGNRCFRTLLLSACHWCGSTAECSCATDMSPQSFWTFQSEQRTIATPRGYFTTDPFYQSTNAGNPSAAAIVASTASCISANRDCTNPATSIQCATGALPYLPGSQWPRHSYSTSRSAIASAPNC